MGSSATAVLLLLLLLPTTTVVSSFEFQVGEIEGWVVPDANATAFYNHWASEKRFQVGDTLRFRYKKDSVMVVDEADYKRCNSTHPIFFSNTGNTFYQLDHSGPYYFISGVAEHCHKGQKMIVKVMADESSYGLAGGDATSSSFSSSGAPLGPPKLLLFQLLLPSAAACLF